MEVFETGRFGPCSNLLTTTDAKIGKVFHRFPKTLFRGTTEFYLTEWAQSYSAFRLRGMTCMAIGRISPENVPYFLQRFWIFRM
jgi:hypothetical protein